MIPTTESTKLNVKKKNYKWFVGIDVSKNELDFAVLRDGELLLHMEIRNEKKEIRAFCQFLKENIPGFRMANTLFCMETTGLYNVIAAKVLYSLKADFAIENALRIKRSSGIVRGKGDREDAIIIANYASKNRGEIRLWQPERQVLSELRLLMALRNRLVTTGVALGNPIGEQEQYLGSGVHGKIKQLCEKTMEAVIADKASVDDAINELIAGDVRIKRLFEIITSVKNIGRVTAAHIILATNEFIDISCPKKFACYSGVAPFKIESGTMRRKPRISRIASRNMKALLHICAVGALRNPELKQYFERKTKIDGKPSMAVMNAIRYKLILRIFACVKQDRLYRDDYIRCREMEEKPIELLKE